MTTEEEAEQEREDSVLFDIRSDEA
jgi:hypothetical protein